MKTKLGFIGRNIRYLRRKRGWTLATLAAKAGMSEVPLGRIERCLNDPSAYIIHNLSKALDVTVDTLFAQEHELFRVRCSETEKKTFLVSTELNDLFTPQIKSMAHDIIEGFHALEDICRVQKRAKIPLFIPLEAGYQGMEKLSLNVRKYMGIEHGIVFDYFELFESQGFRIIVLPMPKEIDGFSYYDTVNQNAFFFLNAKKNSERQLFHLMYELGTILLMTDAMQKKEIFPQEVTQHHAAQYFAATFLMPAKAVRDTVKQLGIQKKYWSYELLLRIKHRFGVSAEAFLYRLDELDLIDSSLVPQLKDTIHKHYGKTGFSEPDLSRRILTPNGRLWDLVLTGKESKEGQKEVLEIEEILKKWKVIRK